jgi:hypothetical protein
MIRAMTRVRGIGGVFFQSENPEALRGDMPNILASWAMAKTAPCFAGASHYGTFGWIMDPDGNHIELWEPLPKKSGS